MIFQRGHRYTVGESNPSYRGDKAGINAIHRWVERRKLKPDVCEICHLNPPVDLANISGKYLRDLNDWKYLCRRCHMESDGRIRNPESIHRQHVSILDNIICSDCGSNRTLIRKSGKPKWIYLNGVYICNKCYMIRWHESHPTP